MPWPWQKASSGLLQVGMALHLVDSGGGTGVSQQSLELGQA